MPQPLVNVELPKELIAKNVVPIQKKFAKINALTSLNLSLNSKRRNNVKKNAFKKQKKLQSPSKRKNAKKRASQSGDQLLDIGKFGSKNCTY